ncbi:DNA-binding protein [Micromonospora echinofusca]|uniref:DNA-binding protein n=1 Tax=Micromonospora echinofusca TaxID=47858 RepID=A0ABS3VQU4_MICEH|nr:DNA-binding protein [Micromonospora echinofusca]MBO4206909.1 DNA-binding protein [Micromonospora echinofusca]
MTDSRPPRDQPTLDPSTGDPFTPPDAGRLRAHRHHAALARITERHADTEQRRRRWSHPTVPDPYEAVCLVTALLSGGAQAEPGEEPVDPADLTAALTLVPHVRAEIDALEAGLLQLARDRGMTWQSIAFGLGLGSVQAARQRYERLSGRVAAGNADDD